MELLARVGSLERQVAERDQIIAERDRTITALEEQMAALLARVDGLTRTIAELEARLASNSSNSSRLPSSDPPWTKKKPKRAPPKRKGKAGRKRGGQRGHKGTARSFVAPEDVDEFIRAAPSQCTGCGHVVPGDAAFWIARRHQVTEIPTPQRHITEHQYLACRCEGCDQVCEADDTAGVTRSAFGPNVHALAALLTGAFRMSRRNTSAAFATLYGLDISVGAIQNLIDRVSAAIAPTVDQVAHEVHSSPAVHADETSWPFARGKGWLWVATTPDAALFHIDEHRSRQALAELLPPEYPGVVHCDRWRPYEVYAVGRRQLCHAHLRRDIQGLIDRGGAAKPIGERLLAESNRLFHAWHQFQAEALTRRQLRRATVVIRARWAKLAKQAKASPDKKARALGKDMLRQWPALWTFIGTDEVEPTNNDAERALRHGVIWRKLSFGSDSVKGAIFASRILTVVETARRRGADLLDWMKRAVVAATQKRPPPALQPA